MSRELDARARRATAGLKSAVAGAELNSAVPGAAPPRRPWIALMRPAWIAALLVIGSAVGVAMVLDSTPSPQGPPPTAPPVVTTTTAPSTTTTTEPAPSTSAAAVPVAPDTTTTTTTPPDVEAPPLEITSPEDGAELKDRTVTFAGITEPGARVFAGKYEADVDSEGNWHITLVLNEGSNVARFVARDDAGNESEASVQVFYVVPTTTTTEPATTTTEEKKEEPKEEEKPAGFSANAKFGSCSETPPFDVYYGTGEPGTLVEVTSEYGSGSTEVGAEGHWEIEVTFVEPPPEEYFLVKVTDTLGRKVELEFVYLP